MDQHLLTIQKNVKRLKKTDEQLAYLALLTSRGLKPLSRWEKPISDECISILQEMNLHIDRVIRTVQTGREITETIFSTLEPYINLYKRRFDRLPVEKSLETVRFEGYVFGFPPCCTETFFGQPYAGNNLLEEDQKILFHWACPQCRITPYILPLYRDLHDFLQEC